MTLLSRNPAYNGLRDDLLTNDPANSSSFTTFDFEVVKRFSRKWQMVTGFDVNQYKTWRFAVANGHDIQTDTTGRAQDPNLLRLQQRPQLPALAVQGAGQLRSSLGYQQFGDA